MPSSTSNSEHRINRHYETPALAWKRASITALILMLLGTTVWEVYWRSKSYEPSTLNNMGLWSETRRKIGQNGLEEVAIVGSSRILFDLDLKVLARELESPYPIQLALEGTNPRPFLHDLAEDKSFKGLLIVGVSTGLFFAPHGGLHGDMLANFKNQTPSDRFGHHVSKFITSGLSLFEPDLALFELVRSLNWPARDGMPPRFLGVKKLSTFDEHREADMWRRVEEDPIYQKRAQDTWTTILSFGGPKLEDSDIDAILGEVVDDVKAIESRGGRVVFVRCPSAGPFLEAEAKGFPRPRFWDQLITRTGSQGIHFEDHQQLQGFELPEWSHLARKEKERFTVEVASLIKRQLLDTHEATETEGLKQN